jgi:RES domain-containing protein
MEESEIQQQRIEDLISSIRWQQAMFTGLDGNFYRTVSYRYSRQPLSTRGAELTGGRYNFRPPNGTSFSCLYCASRDFTASTEKFYNLKTQNAPLPPHTVVCLMVQLQRVLDLTSPDKCESANIDWHELNQPWEYYQDLLNIPAYTQRIGAIA